MNTYQVQRPFSDYQVGDTLQDGDFVSLHRARQLVDQRYLSLVAVEDQQPVRRRGGKKKAEDEQTN
jgi:hypothetical protein